MSKDGYPTMRHWMNGGALTGFLGDQMEVEVRSALAEVERLRKRLQACQSIDASPLTDDCITQNERFLLAEVERLRADLAAERALADQLADVLRIIVRDWCPSTVRVPILAAHDAARNNGSASATDVGGPS